MLPFYTTYLYNTLNIANVKYSQSHNKFTPYKILFFSFSSLCRQCADGLKNYQEFFPEDSFLLKVEALFILNLNQLKETLL